LEIDDIPSARTFHEFVQSKKASETMTLEWFTLAMGKPFIRRSQEDEYLTARFYQIEAMLASAFGTLHSEVSEYKFRALQLRQLDDRSVVLPWSGGDSHCSIKDIWAGRPGIQAEDELAETRAAQLVTHRQTQQDAWATNIESDAHLCTFDDCPRAGHGQGFGSSYSLIRHLESHKTEDN
jgi:hypothetical protein